VCDGFRRQFHRGEGHWLTDTFEVP
jgi:hypothetical protein